MGPGALLDSFIHPAIHPCGVRQPWAGSTPTKGLILTTWAVGRRRMHIHNDPDPHQCRFLKRRPVVTASPRERQPS